MKKVIAILLSIFLVVLSACSNEPKPSDRYSENTVNGVVKAIEIIDEFLEYEISAKEASEKLKDIADRIDSDVFVGDTFYDSLMSTSVLNISVLIGLSDIGSSSAEDIEQIKQLRDDLYNDLYSQN